MTTQRKSKWIRCIQLGGGILAVLPLFFMKFRAPGASLYWPKMAVRMMQEDGFHPEYLIFVLTSLFVLASVIRIVLILRGKRQGWYSYLPVVSLVVYGGMLTVITNTMDLTLYVNFPLYYIIVSIVEFLSVKYLEQQEEINERYETIQEEERREKAHRKKADYFPGKYPKEFYQVIRANLRYRGKDQAVFIMAGAMLAAICYIVIAMYQMTNQLYGGKGETHTALVSVMFGEGIHRLFQSLALILGILSVLMMTLVTSWYMKEQKKEYRLMVILGIRKNTAYRIFLAEFFGNLLIGALIGIPAGALGSVFMRMSFAKSFPKSVDLPGVVSVSRILTGFLVYLVLMLLALGFNQENFIALGNSTNLTEEKIKERRPERNLVFGVILGIFFYVLGMKWFSIRGWAEMKVVYVLPVLGILGLLMAGMGLWLKRRKCRAAYYQGLFRWHTWYYHFWKNAWVMFYLSIIQFLLLSMFSPAFISSMMKQNVETMYPYDLVCTAYESDLPELEQIVKKAGADVIEYPMVRMTSLYGSDQIPSWAGPRPVQWPQGQHIAISETSYHQMRERMGKKANNLALSGEDMHVVYQQDLSVKTNTIDWDTTRIEKHLRFGQPLQYYDTVDYEKAFPKRRIVSEERDSLIGSFQQGKQENLIVLSDEYFEKVWKKITSHNQEHWAEREHASEEEWILYTGTHTGNLTEGPTMLLCINVPDGTEKQVAEQMEYLKEKNRFDQLWDRSIQPFYEKTQMIQNTESEILLTRTANGFILLILLMMAVFQYVLFVREEERNWKWENDFLEKLGMKQKDRWEKIVFQLRFFILLPLVQALIGGVLFAALTGKARLFTGEEGMEYAMTLGIVYLIYATIWLGIYLAMKHDIKKRVIDHGFRCTENNLETKSGNVDKKMGV